MRRNNTLLLYLRSTLTLFGFTMVVLNVFCLLFGDSAREYASIFRLGSAGVPAAGAFQMLAALALIEAARFLFFTDVLFREMRTWMRLVGLLCACIGIVAVFAYAFGWFPVSDPAAWIGFFICFGICFVVSVLLTAFLEHRENEVLAQGLRKLRERSRTDRKDEGPRASV